MEKKLLLLCTALDISFSTKTLVKEIATVEPRFNNMPRER